MSSSKGRPRSEPAEVRFSRFLIPGVIPAARPKLGPCVLFTGADNGNGYGQFSSRGKNGYAHRYAWTREHGEIPAGLTVDHLCRVRRCVRTDHMELVTAVENFQRGAATKTHCPNGHQYEDEFTPGRSHTKTRWRCPTCKEEQIRLNGVRRTRTAANLPDRRVKYDPVKRDDLVHAVIEGQLSVAAAAGQLGCAMKYMDKRVRLRRRELGLITVLHARHGWVRLTDDGGVTPC